VTRDERAATIHLSRYDHDTRPFAFFSPKRAIERDAMRRGASERDECASDGVHPARGDNNASVTLSADNAMMRASICCFVDEYAHAAHAMRDETARS